MKNSYDIIIVGAGPAGLKCAEQLKNTNLSVLLIEKNDVIGPKECGGGITPQVDTSDMPSEKIRFFPIIKTRLNDKENDIYLPETLKIIDRYDMGQHQLRKIENVKNIKILTGTKVKTIENDKILCDKGIFYYRYLVGADGSNSIVRKYLGLKTKIVMGIKCDLPIITNKLKWEFYPRLLRTGYFWVFPHKKYTNIGVFFDPKCINPKKAKKLLINFLRKNGFYNSNIEFKGGIGNYFYKGCVFNNIFLVGDAAGLVSKVFGEGISFATVSGSEIGKKILDSKYKMPRLKKHLKLKRRQEILSFFIDIFKPLQTLGINFFIKMNNKTWFQYYFGWSTEKTPEPIKIPKINPIGKKIY